jgi:hypothetical protein
MPFEHRAGRAPPGASAALQCTMLYEIIETY